MEAHEEVKDPVKRKGNTERKPPLLHQRVNERRSDQESAETE